MRKMFFIGALVVGGCLGAVLAHPNLAAGLA